jgi:hypothetical protein
MADSYCPYICIYLFLNKMKVLRKSTWKSGRVSKWKPHGYVSGAPATCLLLRRELCVRALIAACMSVAQLGYDLRMGNK